MLDPISDMLTRIRNAQRANRRQALMPFSKVKLAIAKILEQEKFVDGVSVEHDGTRKMLQVALKYTVLSPIEKVPAIREIRRISTQGQRMYVKKDMIRKIRSGFGISVISTSQGIMTGAEARKRGMGGEVICEVW